MADGLTNIAASVEQRLLNKARQEARAFATQNTANGRLYPLMLERILAYAKVYARELA